MGFAVVFLAAAVVATLEWVVWLVGSVVFSVLWMVVLLDVCPVVVTLTWVVVSLVGSGGFAVVFLPATVVVNIRWVTLLVSWVLFSLACVVMLGADAVVTGLWFVVWVAVTTDVLWLNGVVIILLVLLEKSVVTAWLEEVI